MDIDTELPAAFTREDSLLAAMATLPGVTCVSRKPIGDGSKPNNHGVRWKLNGSSHREACSKADGDKPTLMHAIEAALDKLRGSLGKDVVDNAVTLAGLPAASYSADELDWLASWCESHDAPETITAEMADDALKTRRSQVGGSSAVAVLQEAQLLEAQRRAAERSVERARQHLAHVTGEIERRRPPKQQRVATEEWRSREYGEWPDEAGYWRQQEGYAYSRRRTELSAEQPARPAEKRPRGEADGPLTHWRYGLVGALQYWSNGSKTEAAQHLAALAKRLDLKASRRPLPRHAPRPPQPRP